MKQKRISVYAAILAATLLASLLFSMGASAAVLSANETISEEQSVATSEEFVPSDSLAEDPSSSPSQVDDESLDTQLPSSSSEAAPASEITDDTESVSDPSLLPEDESESASLPEDESESASLPEEISLFAAGDLVEINPTTAEVFTYPALKIAVESPHYTTVLLGQSIEQTAATGNITVVVNKTKPSFVLDGQGHTFTQIPSAGIERTISVDGSNTVTKNVTVRNMQVIGANYWGIVHIGSTGVSYTLDSVNYNGPQPAYNPGGTAYFINTTIELKERGTVSQEIAEAAHVVFGGTVSIVKTTTLYSLIWLKGASTSLTVLPNANVRMNTEFYFIYADGSSPTVNIGESASVDLTTKQGFTWDAQSIDSLVLEENAALTITQNGDRGFSGMYIRNLFHAKPGSKFQIARFAGTRPAIEMLAANAQIVFDNPNHVAIYSSAGKAFQFSTNNALTLRAGSVNRWAQGSWPMPHSLNNLPDFSWNKSNNENLILVIKVTGTTINSFTHNLAAEDPTPANKDLTIANFALFATKLYTFGQIPLTIDTVSNISNNVQGGTLPNAVVRANYTTETGAPAELNGAANASGVYSLPIAENEYAEKDTTLTMLSFANALVTRKRTVVQGEEKNKLKFVFLPETLPFSNVPLPNEAALIGRQEADWHISVQDNRASRTPWRVDAVMHAPLTAMVNGQTHTLPNALVYVDEQNNRTPLGEDLLTVFSYEAETPSELVDITWGDKTGLMLWVPPGAAQSDVTYSATIQWVLTDAP